MIIIQFLEYLFHYGLTEQHCFGIDTELITILLYCSHLTIIQIDDLPMATHQRLLLLLQIIRVDRRHFSSLLCHLKAPIVIYAAKLAFY